MILLPKCLILKNSLKVNIKNINECYDNILYEYNMTDNIDDNIKTIVKI